MNILHNETLRTIALLTTSSAYVSSKRGLAKSIINIIETIPHGVYAKFFVGMGGIFVMRKRVSFVENINDRSGDVVNFFCVATLLSAFYDLLQFPISSRQELQYLLMQDPKALMGLERTF